MLIIATFGLVCNLVMGKILHAGHHHNHDEINIRAAYIHILGDIIQCIGVMLAAGIIYTFEGMEYVDPLCTYMFSVIVFYTTVPIVKECMIVLM